MYLDCAPRKGALQPGLSPRIGKWHNGRCWQVLENHSSVGNWGPKGAVRCGGSACPAAQRVRERIRLRHYSIRTERAYCDWIKRFVIFHGKRHPSELGAAEVEAFLTAMAVQGRVAASTQKQAKSALRFLHK